MPEEDLAKLVLAFQWKQTRRYFLVRRRRRSLIVDCLYPSMIGLDVYVSPASIQSASDSKQKAEMSMIGTGWMVIFFFSFVKVDGANRRYRLFRDEQLNEDGLSQFSVLNWDRNEYLYRLKTFRLGEDGSNQITLKKYPEEHSVGFVQGQWTGDSFNVYFDVYDEGLSQWINGTIEKHSTLVVERYSFDYDGRTFEMSKKIFSRKKKFFESQKKNSVLGDFYLSFRWFHWSLVEYQLKIYSDQLPDRIYFIFIPIFDQRNHF